MVCPGWFNTAMLAGTSISHLIRLATVEDVAAIFRVRTSVTENVLTLQQLADLGVTPATLASIIGSDPCVWVAQAQGEVVGFAMIERDTACLFAAFVLPQHENQGIGRDLVAVCEQALLREHARAWLETDGSSRAAGFYRHLGWSHCADLDHGDVRLEKWR